MLQNATLEWYLAARDSPLPPQVARVVYPSIVSDARQTRARPISIETMSGKPPSRQLARLDSPLPLRRDDECCSVLTDAPLTERQMRFRLRDARRALPPLTARTGAPRHSPPGEWAVPRAPSDGARRRAASRREEPLPAPRRVLPACSSGRLVGELLCTGHCPEAHSSPPSGLALEGSEAPPLSHEPSRPSTGAGSAEGGQRGATAARERGGLLATLGCTLDLWERSLHSADNPMPALKPRPAYNPASAMLETVRSQSEARAKAGFNMYWAKPLKKEPVRTDSIHSWDEETIVNRPLAEGDMCLIVGGELARCQCKIIRTLSDGVSTVQITIGPPDVQGLLRTLPSKYLERMRPRRR
ncbi:hypothetical protein AB1Y20_004452 [Prymnesium parvum]|uniref:Uncharacterized protein n=1 Tax=Prymnesium parvum TaxID=97485 RepID=A0AB34IWG6_PRYPA